jgi:hypothetical protein
LASHREFTANRHRGEITSGGNGLLAMLGGVKSQDTVEEETMKWTLNS